MKIEFNAESAVLNPVREKLIWENYIYEFNVYSYIS